MNKGLKWLLIIFGAFVVLFLAVAIIVPAVFKDDIKALLEKEVAKSVNADVVFEDFDLSFFSNFPNITASLDNLGVMNRAPFEGEMLFATEKFEVEVNLADMLFSDAMQVKGISLIRPVINVIVLKDGRANYDIAIPSEDTTATEEPSEFSFGIDHWEIVDGDVSYDDQSLNMLLTLGGLNHSGSGDFTQDVFDMKTKTVADSVSTSFEGVEYLTNKKVDIDATLNISEEYSKYTFKDNTAKVNDFAMHVDGWLKLNENDMEMDLAFNTPENSFKSLLSLASSSTFCLTASSVVAGFAVAVSAELAVSFLFPRIPLTISSAFVPSTAFSIAFVPSSFAASLTASFTCSVCSSITRVGFGSLYFPPSAIVTGIVLLGSVFWPLYLETRALNCVPSFPAGTSIFKL